MLSMTTKQTRECMSIPKDATPPRSGWRKVMKAMDELSLIAVQRMTSKRIKSQLVTDTAEENKMLTNNRIIKYNVNGRS